MFSGVDKAVEALLRGQECANHLKTMLPRTSLVPVEPLFDTILDSFSDALTFFTNFISSDFSQSSQSFSQNIPTRVARNSPKKKRYGEDSSGNYSVDSATPMKKDGFSWRKYGQKPITTSPYPRCYYRCAYAKDKNCKASKRVQKIQANPSVYRSTYIGKHICEVNAFSQTDESITNNSRMIRFDQLEQVMSDMVLPQLVSVDHQEIIQDNSLNETTNQEFDNFEFLLGDEQLWESQFSPDNYMSLDDISVFDYNPFEV